MMLSVFLLSYVVFVIYQIVKCHSLSLSPPENLKRRHYSYKQVEKKSITERSRFRGTKLKVGTWKYFDQQKK